jgi:hypothetical protein
VLENPGKLASNAAKALGLGFEQFGANFLDHFIAGAVEWITKMPATSKTRASRCRWPSDGRPPEARPHLHTCINMRIKLKACA